MPRPPAKTYIRTCYGAGGLARFYEYGLLGPNSELWPAGQATDCALAMDARDCLARALAEIEMRKKAASWDQLREGAAGFRDALNELNKPARGAGFK